MPRKLFLPLGVVLLAFPLQPAGKFELTIDNIMQGPNLFGYPPSEVRWSGDSQRIYFSWKRANESHEADSSTYVAGRDGSALRKLSDADAKLAPPVGGASTIDRRKTVYVRDGDIFLYEADSGQTRQLTKTGDLESDPKFLRDGKRITYARANNLYAMSLETGFLEQLTDIRAAGTATPAGAPPAGARGGGQSQVRASAGEPQKGTDSQEFLKKEERDLLEVVRERATKREQDEEKKKKENPRKPFNLQARQTITSLQLSPDEKYVTALVSEGGEKTKTTIVPNFVTESSYTEDISSRTKVGDQQNHLRLALLGVETGEVKWLDPELKREVEFGQPVWSEDGSKAVVFARAADNKDRWILAVDSATAKTRVLGDDHDDAWVAGPGMQTLGWMKGDDRIFFQSERSGYSHLYSVAFSGGEPVALTSGKWQVESVQLSRDRSRFFLVTNETDPGEHHVYEMNAEGGERKRLTKAVGSHTVLPSPDEKSFADIYSYTNKPPELYVQQSLADAASKKLTSSPAPEFFEYPWLDTPIATFSARDGATLRARLYKPANWKTGGPAVIFVHGAGYMQNVHRWWSSSYSHEYLFNNLLMTRGFLVVEVDYRGSAGYGRDWRTGIYDHMGGKDLDDEVDTARWIVRQHGVDPKKIGMYGGSYGGFMTLMAMFTQPDVFAAGAALRPVTDWAHYNHGYTSAILNQPQSDPEAYRKSSPIYFANGLKGSLLICHGMVDTNVHFQDTVRLVQKLIELRKPNWELAVYPVENHGFVEPTSWADEYKRILALFERALK